MHRFYCIGLEKCYIPMIWLDKNQNHLLWCQNDVVMSFVERINQGESLASWLNWFTEPPAVSWSVIMGDLSPCWKGVFWTLTEDRTTKLCCAQHACCNIMPCVNAAYGNDMEWRNPCAIYQDLVTKCMQTYPEALLWLGDNIGLLWWLVWLQLGLHKHSRWD